MTPGDQVVVEAFAAFLADPDPDRAAAYDRHFGPIEPDDLDGVETVESTTVDRLLGSPTRFVDEAFAYSGEDLARVREVVARLDRTGP